MWPSARFFVGGSLMPGPPPKDPRLRQRRNKVSTQAVLKSDKPEEMPRPALPARVADQRPWHPRTVAWWAELWSSPMAPEFVRFDANGLVDLAELQDQYHYKPDANTLREIRLQRACFGLTPIDRRRLGWEVKREGEEPEQPEAQAVQPTKANDPRNILTMVPGRKR